MTDAINFFQSYLSFNSFSSIGANRAEIRLANALRKDARRLASEAGEETQNAQTAQKIASDAKEQNARRNFVEIALWHTLIALGKYRQAAARYNEAAMIETIKQREFIKNAGKMAEQATKAESEIKRLTAMMNQN